LDLAGKAAEDSGGTTKPPLNDYSAKDCLAFEGEGFVNDHLEPVEQGCCGCFCLESVNDEIKVSRPDDQGVLQVVGCRSLNCRAVKAKDLIHVARSNHFAQVERRDDILDESCRRDWELADEGFTEVRVGPSQEKDSDFFYKVRSFLKRQGRILHKQGKRLSPSRNGKRDTNLVITGSIGEKGRSVVNREVISGTAVRDIGQKEAADLVIASDPIHHEEASVGKKDGSTNELGIRPLMGDDMLAPDTGLIKLAPRSKEEICCDVGKDVFEPSETGSENEEIECSSCNQCSGSGSAHLSCNACGNGTLQLDIGCESKRRKAYKYESTKEEVAPRFGRDEVEGEFNPSLEDDRSPVEGMERDALPTELEVVRHRILYGNHGRSHVQRRDTEVSPSPHYAGSLHHMEIPTGNLPRDTELDATESKNLTLGVEKDQTTTQSLAGSVGRKITGFSKEEEWEEGHSKVVKGEKHEWEQPVYFWDGSQQRWESADEVSEGDYGENENWNNSNWSDGAVGEDGKGLNGCFYEYGSNLDGLREAIGFSQNDGTEDWNNTEGTRWFRPPDVYDSYVKYGEVHNNAVEDMEAEIGSQCLRGGPESGTLLNHNEFGHYSQEIGVHNSQLKGIDLTGSSEMGDRVSELSPFVGTLWYKAPELLYGATKYGKGLDMWAVGCIFAELLGGKPLFPGVTDIDQLSRVVRVLGPPSEKVWPGISQLPDFDKISFHDVRAPLSFQKLLPHVSLSSIQFLKKLLVYDPAQRLSAEAALGDSYFTEDPLPSALLKELNVIDSRQNSSASEEWAEWRDPGSPLSDFEILDPAP
jgi:serine/threonine protein kinase